MPSTSISRPWRLAISTFFLCVLTVVVWAPFAAVYAQTTGLIEVLHTFPVGSTPGSFPEGANPYGGLVQGADGNYYGTNSSGGTKGAGTIYKITPLGEVTVLYNFEGPEGSAPGGLVLGPDGDLYGITEDGGPAWRGTIFKISTSGTFTVLYSFSGGSDGGDPLTGLTVGRDGRLYGTTWSGGTYNNGTIFRMTTAGDLTTLYSFRKEDENGLFAPDGSQPRGRLVEDAAGNLWGTTQSGGSFGFGTVFKLSSSGSYTVVHNFSSIDGSGPAAGVVIGDDGNLYGTTQYGGLRGPGCSIGCGVVFKLTPTGLLTVLHAFAGGESGAAPLTRLVAGSSSSFLGGTYSGGANNRGILYEITTDGTFAVLHSFSGSTDGAIPTALIQGDDGYYYGTALNGGVPNKGGVIFRFGYCLGTSSITPTFATEAAPSCSLPITARIFFGDVDVTNTKTPQRVIVGQQIPLTVKFFQNGQELRPPNPVITTLKWDIAGPTVAGYTPSIEKATVQPLITTDINKRGITFYWVSGPNNTNRTVEFRATASNQPVIARTTFTVARPSARITTKTTGVLITSNWDGGLTSLAFGPGPNTNEQFAGIVFERTNVSIPTGFQGSWQWVQLANINRRRFRVDTNQWESLTSVGVLDCTTPDDQGNVCIDYAYNGPNNEKRPPKVTDSPRTPLTAALGVPLTNPPINQSEVNNESFTMYLMFQPSFPASAAANAIWVPLRRVDWFWSGKATSDETRLNWQLVPGSAANSVNPVDADAPRHPTWTQNFPQLQWKP